MARAFRDITIGETFTFASERDFPYSGIAKGPWIKISTRKYVRHLDSDAIEYRVGSITAKVI
jgi:hypothetical protein